MKSLKRVLEYKTEELLNADPLIKNILSDIINLPL